MTGEPNAGAFAEIASDPEAFERFYREHVEGVSRAGSTTRISRPT